MVVSLSFPICTMGPGKIICWNSKGSCLNELIYKTQDEKKLKVTKVERGGEE